MPEVREKIVQYRIVVTGRVQGVSFRTSLGEVARRHRVIGWVRNRTDGSVEAIVQGNEEAVRTVMAWARHGPVGARVADVILQHQEPSNDMRDFEIRQ